MLSCFNLPKLDMTFVPALALCSPISFPGTLLSSFISQTLTVSSLTLELINVFASFPLSAFTIVPLMISSLTASVSATPDKR